MAKQNRVVTSIQIPDEINAKLRKWSAKKKLPFALLIRRLLLLVPWWDDSVDIMICPIPKTVLRDRDKLESWMRDCTEEIKAKYGL